MGLVKKVLRKYNIVRYPTMPKTKQLDLKREFKAINSSHKEAMAMKCAECLGFFVDGYEKCTSLTCPLLKFFPLSSYINKSKFIDKMKEKAKEMGNDNSFVARIGRRLDLSSKDSKKADGVEDDQKGAR